MNLLKNDRPPPPSSGIYTQTSGYSPLHKCTVDPTVPLASTPPLKIYVQFFSVSQLCPTLFDPMNHSTPGLPIHHQLLEFTPTHVRRVSEDRKSTRLNSSHQKISYAVFCL